MIVPMRRLSLVLLASERDAVLAKLRSLGAVHLDERLSTTPEQDAVLNRYKLVQDALSFLEKSGPPKTEPAPADALDRVVRLMRETRMMEETVNQWLKRLEFWAPWGDFDPADLRALAEKGLYVHLYQAPKTLESLYSGLEGYVPVGRDKAQVRFAIVSKSPEPIDGPTHVPWPEIAPSKKQKMVDELRGHLKEYAERAALKAGWIPSLKTELAELEKQIDWEAAKGGLGTEDNLVYLSGWVPADQDRAVLAFAQEAGVAVAMGEPQAEHSPPTKLKNSFFPNLMKPVFELLGITPGYAERDISWPFFLFFSVFFGMILGDAAYGVILTTLGGVFLVRSLLTGGKGKEAWILFTWLGFCTIAWGSVTGTWFAVDFNALPSFLQALVPGGFNPNVVGAEAVSNNITVFCFTLGAVQLGLASLWNFLQMVWTNPLKSVSHLGWLGLTFSLYLLVLSMVAKASLLPAFFPEPLLSLLFTVTPTGPQLPDWVLPAIVGSYLAVLLFSFQEGKFWRGLGEGVANFLPTSLNAISAFADNISYIRLFAVGLAGYYIEVSFASMAAGFGMDSVGGVVATVLVLVFGHSLNLVMGFLSVIVHGIRLNVLEFSNRLGMEWSGRPYDPFRVKS